MGYNAITTSFSKYANVYWGLEGGAFAYTLMIAQAAAVIAYVPVGIISTKFAHIVKRKIFVKISFKIFAYFAKQTGVKIAF